MTDLHHRSPHRSPLESGESGGTDLRIRCRVSPLSGTDLRIPLRAGTALRRPPLRGALRWASRRSEAARTAP